MARIVHLIYSIIFAVVNFERHNRIRAIKAANLLALFIFIWCSSNLFSHTHIVNSEVVTHSHPYTSTGHSHSGLEFQTIAMLSLSLALVVWSVFHLACTNGVRKSENYQTFNVVSPFGGALHLLRAPPVFC